MAAAAKVTFTEAQWEELERQAMIFKYMMASLPVPPQFLNPTSKSSSPLPSASQSHSNKLLLLCCFFFFLTFFVPFLFEHFQSILTYFISCFLTY